MIHIVSRDIIYPHTTNFEKIKFFEPKRSCACTSPHAAHCEFFIEKKIFPQKVSYFIEQLINMVCSCVMKRFNEQKFVGERQELDENDSNQNLMDCSSSAVYGWCPSIL